MKSWKKRWQEELDAAVPALKDEVLNEPIPTCDRAQTVAFAPASEPWYKKLFATPQRIASFAAACVVCVAAVGASAYLFRPTAPLTVEQEVISVEVNPQAVFTVDKEGKVTAVAAVNQDADVVLAEERYLEMQGKSVQEAVEIFVDYTAKLGYLDLNTPDAVRITSCVENGWLDKVGDALENYFCGKGAYIAVAAETVGLDAFCQRVNMEVCDSVQSLKSSVERIPALTFLRETGEKTAEELQQIYAQTVPLEEVKGIFRSTLSAVEKRVEDYLAISELSDDIRYHKDNNFGFLGFEEDYWSILDKEIPDTMSEMMAEMSEKLLAYERNYGKKIDGLDDLIKEGVKCSTSALATVVKSLSDSLLSTSLDLLSKNFQAVSVLLKSFDIDTTLLEELLELPETVDAYYQKVNEYTKERFALLQEEARTGYEAVREEISASDYEAYIAGLEREYGSLSEYFKNL